VVDTGEVDEADSLALLSCSIVIPDSRLVEGIVKVFVKTGPGWDECAEAHRIEIDIKQAGEAGSLAPLIYLHFSSYEPFMN
jgi:hypothetical protein